MINKEQTAHKLTMFTIKYIVSKGELNPQNNPESIAAKYLSYYHKYLQTLLKLDKED